jgi:thymidylate synthase
MNRHSALEYVVTNGLRVGRTLEVPGVVIHEPMSVIKEFDLDPSDEADLVAFSLNRDGPRYQGYANTIHEQMPNALDLLHRDQNTRQAVMWVYEPKQHQCLLNIQVMRRRNHIISIGTFRSHDIWRFGNLDLTLLATVGGYFASELDLDIDKTEIILQAGSGHVQMKDVPEIQDYLKKWVYTIT